MGMRSGKMQSIPRFLAQSDWLALGYFDTATARQLSAKEATLIAVAN
jgi:hypothetical protein